MRSIASFYTYFWIIYFPTCIAFYDVGPTVLVDEIMTVILFIYTIFHVEKRGTVRSPIKETTQYMAILAFFVFYSLFFGENVYKAVLRDMVQWVRPFSVIYCTWILNPHFSQKQKNWMLYSMLATLGAWIYYHPEVGFGSGAEFPVLGQLAVSTGMAWYLWKPDTLRNRYIALGIVLLGLLAPKFKFLGEVVCFIYAIFFMKKKLNFKSPKTIVTLTLVLTIVIFVTWSKFDAYYVTGFGSNEMARPMTYRIGFTQIIWEYFPFGSGMGTWGCAAAADYYSPLLYKYGMSKVWGCTPDFRGFIADAFYPTLCQLGVFGIFCFCVFWKRRLVAFNKIRDMRYYRVAWIAFFCLAIEQTADTSFLSGKGMGYCMLIALCLNANRNMTVRKKIPVLQQIDNDAQNNNNSSFT